MALRVPSQLGLTDPGPGAFNLNTIAFSNEGSWSTMRYLPMAMVENRAVGVTWFWQSNIAARGIGSSETLPTAAPTTGISGVSPLDPRHQP